MNTTDINANEEEEEEEDDAYERATRERRIRFSGTMVWRKVSR